MLEIKSTVKEIKNAFDGLLVDWTQRRKESLSLTVGQQKLPQLKSREKTKTERNKTEYPRTVGQL